MELVIAILGVLSASIGLAKAIVELLAGTQKASRRKETRKR